MKNVLAIGAHPDDVEFGCSGTILEHSKKGDRVIILVMTNSVSVDGTTGKVIRTHTELKKETAKAAELMDAQLEFLNFKDLHVPFGFESVSGIEKIIKKYDIDTIYTHWAGDSNQDHIATYKATIAAARYIKNVYCYEQIPIPRHTENEMKPNMYKVISDIDIKLKVAQCHKSQLRKYTAMGFDVLDNLEILARYRGIQADTKYAEAFQIIKTVL